MQRDQFAALFDTAVAVAVPHPTQTTIAAAVGALAQVAAWVESMQLLCARELDALSLPAERILADSSRCNARDAERVVARANTAAAAPVFETALADGRVAGAHLDQLTVSLRRLEPEQRQTLLASSDRLVALAAATTPDEFGRALRAEERRLATDDGMARLERQRSAVRLQVRRDIESGMHHFHLMVDPLTGLKLHNKIAAATEALFHDKTPELCPSDPFEKQSFLRAHALLNIIEGKGIRLGSPEIVVVVDTTEVDEATGQPIVDWGLPVEIPHRVLLDLFHVADVHAVVVRYGAVLHAPGELNLGRTTRLASRAQRRALRAVYPTCAIRDCTVPFDKCDVHHVEWWEHGGPTDLNNLVPGCHRHHAAIHRGEMHLQLAADRTLTVTYPDGTAMSTGPPKRRAA